MECTAKCRFTKHAELILSVITKEDSWTIQAILPRICSNLARVSDQFGRNALHLAASCGKDGILEWLVKEHSADLEWKDFESGWTSLHRSLFYGHLNCAIRLLQLGSDLRCLDNEGHNALDVVRLDSPFQVATGVQARVILSYETSLNDELCLQVDDVIDNIHMTNVSYWTGELNGKRGLFPKSCIKVLSKDHSLELFTWGSNTNFTLGHRDERTRHLPEIIETLGNDGKVYIKEVVMCKFHSVFLSVDGRVFTCGHGRGGRLGHGDENTVLVLQEIASFQGMKCVAVAAGQDHTVAVFNDGTAFTFGLNDSHQLGHSPPPRNCLLPKMVQMKVWKTKSIVGAAAGCYHSVFFTQTEVYTCGLNAGQLGHSKGERYQILPRQVSSLAQKDIHISMVSCSDGATVCATDKGDVFLLNQYLCRKIVARFVELSRLAVVGGLVDMLSSQDVGKKFEDELTVTMLNSNGMVFEWKPQYGSLRQCHWCHSRAIAVRDIAVGKQLFIVSDDGEAFICHGSGTKSSPEKSESLKMKATRSPSFSSGSTETQLAQSPPLSSRLDQISKEKCDVTLQPNTTPLGRLAVQIVKKNTVDYSLERIPLIHRGTRIFTDSKSRGYAALQVASQEGLKETPQVSPGQIWKHLTQLLQETSCHDDIHDVEFLVKGKAIPAHGFILASRSPKCRQLLSEKKENCPGTNESRIKAIPLSESLEQSVVVRWLELLYSGEKVNDKELLVENSPVKEKNGYHVVKGSKSKKHSSKLRTEVDAKAPMANEDHETVTTMDHSIQGLICLSRNDLDDFTTPTLQSDGKTSERPQSTPSVIRKDKGRDAVQSISKNKSSAFNRLNCPELCDVVIVAKGGVEFHCHKCILVARLEYFRSMLAGGWLEASKECRALTLAVSPDVLEIVLDFLYSDQATGLEGVTYLEFLGNVLVVADQLLISRLTQVCEAVIAKLVTLKNVAMLIEFALLYNANQLRVVCTEFICNNLPSLLEAGSLNGLSHEALSTISKAYRESIPRMAWRMMTPLDLHSHVLSKDSEKNSAKRKRTSSRRKSSKSEGEPETRETRDEGPRTQDVGLIAADHEEEVFPEPQLPVVKCERLVNQESGETDISETPPNTDNKDSLAKEYEDSGLWYRKQSPENISVKKNMGKKKLPTAKPFIDSSLESERTLEKSLEGLGKISSSGEPAWNRKSISSPPAASLKEIIEQEEIHAARVCNPVKQNLSPSKAASKSWSQDERTNTSPQGLSVRWSCSGHQSQKQRKKSKSNTKEDASNLSKHHETKQDEKSEPTRTFAWGGARKDPVPVKSLRDLMQEEQRLETDQSGNCVRTAAPPSGSLSASGKSGSPRKKLSWISQRDFYSEASKDCDQVENVTDILSSPPRRAWQSNPILSSPPSPSVTFSEIVQSQEKESTNLDCINKKPFHLTQLEERAMNELLEHYGGQYNPCELVSVKRVSSATARPLWRKERSPSVAST